MGFVVGIVGKPSCGKTSFTNAACMTDFKVGSYPFTTIDANVGVTHVRTACACADFDVEDDPQNSICIDRVRLIPVKLIDVAGLVPRRRLRREDAPDQARDPAPRREAGRGRVRAAGGRREPLTGNSKSEIHPRSRSSTRRKSSGTSTSASASPHLK